MARYREDTLFAGEKKKHPARWAALILLLIILIGTVVLNIVSNGNVALETPSVTIPTLGAAFRILHISDLHGKTFGQDQYRLSLAWRQSSYSVVCITGDMIGPDGDTAPLNQLLDNLTESVPVLIIPGDEDPDPVLAVPHENDTPFADWVLEAREHGAIYLDSPYAFSNSGVNVWFVPENAANLDLDVTQKTLETRRQQLLLEADSPEKEARLRVVDYHEDRIKRIREARDQMREGDVFILLTHHPLQESVYENESSLTLNGLSGRQYKVNLVLAGHYNGGQVRLPLVGALYVPESSGLGSRGWFPDQKKVSGLGNVCGVAQYISPGLGNASVYPSWMMTRLFNPPTVTLLSLTTRLTK